MTPLRVQAEPCERTRRTRAAVESGDERSGQKNSVSRKKILWALRDSNPRPAECKWETVRRHRSSMVAFVYIYWLLGRPLSVLSCTVG